MIEARCVLMHRSYNSSVPYPLFAFAVEAAPFPLHVAAASVAVEIIVVDAFSNHAAVGVIAVAVFAVAVFAAAAASGASFAAAFAVVASFVAAAAAAASAARLRYPIQKVLPLELASQAALDCPAEALDIFALEHFAARGTCLGWRYEPADQPADWQPNLRLKSVVRKRPLQTGPT